jgi:hypothetical protein
MLALNLHSKILHEITEPSTIEILELTSTMSIHFLLISFISFVNARLISFDVIETTPAEVARLDTTPISFS